MTSFEKKEARLIRLIKDNKEKLQKLRKNKIMALGELAIKYNFHNMDIKYVESAFKVIEKNKDKE